MQKIKKGLVILWMMFISLNIWAQEYNVRNFGARGDDRKLNTVAIQKAIDRCFNDGGGKVIIPAGIFITGTIELKNNVTLYLSEGAILKASTDSTHYHYSGGMAKAMFLGNIIAEQHQQHGLILAYNQHNIGICGPGRIYGQGESPVYASKDVFNGKSGRPFTFSLEKCSGVRLRDFELLNGAFWNMRLKECSDVVVDGITLKSRVVANNDGLDLIDCDNVRVANCYFNCGDDGICLKSESSKMVKNVVITNCVITSESNAIKFGTAGVGGFENISISNCTVYDTRFSGIAIQMVDGGAINQVNVDNITMHNVNGSIAIKLGQRSGNHPGSIKNITLSNIYCDGIGLWRPDTSAAYYKPLRDLPIGMSIVGQSGYHLENITLNNLTMEFCGGGTLNDAERNMEDRAKDYPEYSNFGRTPAYGINLRHITNLNIRNVNLRTITPDYRPAFFIEDVTALNMANLQMRVTDNAKAFIRIKTLSNALIQGSQPNNNLVPFLFAEGENHQVVIMNNDFQQVKTRITGPAKDSGIVFFNNYQGNHP